LDGNGRKTVLVGLLKVVDRALVMGTKGEAEVCGYHWR
jgi:hypothetical protein